MRHRREDAKPRYLPVNSAVVIEIGDMVYMEVDDARPASAFTWDTNIATTQRAFKKKFVGIAADASAAGQTALIGIDIAGIVELTCASAAFEMFDLVAPAKASGDALEDQKVVEVTERNLAIGKVYRREASVVTTVNFELLPILASTLDDVDADENEAYVQHHVITTDEDTAGAVELDTGWGEVFAGPVQVTYRLVATGVETTQDFVVTKMTAGDAGKISIADGSGVSVVATNILSVIAHRYNS